MPDAPDWIRHQVLHGLSELKRMVPDVSQKVLIHALREMEEHGVVHREVFKEVPPRVEYTATKLGFSLEPVIKSLCVWGRRHAVELNQLDLLDECRPGVPNDGRQTAR